MTPSECGAAQSSGRSGGSALQAGELDRACGELETMRRRCLLPFLTRMAVGVMAIAALVIWITTYPAHPDPLVIGMVSGFFALILWVYWVRRPRETYRDFHRSHFIPAAVRAMGRYQYDANATMPRLWMGRSGLLPEYDLYLSQGLFSAQRSGISVQFAEAQLKRYGTYASAGGASSQGAAPGLAFGGLAILLSLRTAFVGRTVLCPDLGALFNVFKNTPADLNFVRPGVKTARGRYEILSTEPDEARGLLDTALVQRLQGCVRALGGRRFRVSFYDAQVLVMVPLKSNLFRAPSIFRRPVGNAAGIRIFRRVEAVDEIVDTLHRQVTSKV